MMYKKLKLFSIFMLIVSIVSAQDIETAYKLLSYGKTEEAVQMATAVVNADPANLSNKFSQYSLLNAAGKYQEAAQVLSSIKAADESGAFGKTADVLMRLDQGANPDDLTSDIDKAIRKGKKAKGFLYRTVGEYFLFSQKKNPVKAIAFIKTAIDDHSLNNASTRMLLGDAYSLKNDAGNAVTNYEYAMELDKTSAVPHYKIGTTYIRAKNYEFGVPELRKAIETDPEYALAYKDLGKYYYDVTKYDEAKENFGKYMSMVRPTIVEKVQYANILFLAKDYQAAIPLLEEIKREDTANKYPEIQRMLGYSYHETGNDQKALSYLNNFIANRDTARILAQDYLYLGKIQSKLGEDSLSRSNYLLAFEMDSTLEGEIKIIADTLYDQKKYDEAGLFYFARAKSTNLAADYFYATRADYLGGNYVRGIEAANGIISKLPEEVEGYLWKARHSALLDTLNKGAAAVPEYELVIQKGNADKAKYNKQLLEALNWLTVYFINVKQDYKKAQEYNDQALEVDANNDQVMKLFNFLTDATNPAKKEAPKKEEPKKTTTKPKKG